VTQLLLRRDVSDATSGRNFFRIDGEVMKKRLKSPSIEPKKCFFAQYFLCLSQKNTLKSAK